MTKLSKTEMKNTVAPVTASAAAAAATGTATTAGAASTPAKEPAPGKRTDAHPVPSAV